MSTLCLLLKHTSTNVNHSVLNKVAITATIILNDTHLMCLAILAIIAIAAWRIGQVNKNEVCVVH